MDLEGQIKRAKTFRSLSELNNQLPYPIQYSSEENIEVIRERLLKRYKVLQRPSALQLTAMKLPKLRQIAKEAVPPVKFTSKKEILQELLHRLITGGSSTVNNCVEAEEALLTSPLQDYQEIGQKMQVQEFANLDKCLETFGQGEELGGGTSGTVFQGVYAGKKVVFKMTDLSYHGYNSYKWELVMLQRAGKAGIGAKLLGYQVCQIGRKQYGIAILTQCTPFDQARKFSPAEQKKILTLVEKLHQIGIVHLDLYIRNLVRSGSEFAIIDFDLALCFDGPAPPEVAMIDYACLKQEGVLHSLPSFLSTQMKTLVGKLTNDYRLRSELIVNFYPEQMIGTLSYQEAYTWLVYFQKGKFFPVKEERQLENLFAARFGLKIT